MEKLSILINSCDAYSDVWEPFFQILSATWPQAKDYPIYLNTESEDFHADGFDVKVINYPHKDAAWGERLLNTLSVIKTEYVLFLLEDYFFEENVDNNSILSAINLFKLYPDLAMVSFTSPMECSDISYCNSHSLPGVKDYVPRSQKAFYKINAGPAIWKRESLIKWTLKKDSPWVWEFFGTRRTWFSKDMFLARRPDVKPVFLYDIDHGGAVHRGKWVGYKIRELITKYNLSIDLNQREIVEDWMKGYSPTSVPLYRRLPSAIRNRLLGVISPFIGLWIESNHK